MKVMDTLEILLVIYSCAVLINFIANFIMWRAYKKDLYKISCILWGAALFHFITQGLFQKMSFLSAITLVTSYPVSISLRKMLEQSFLEKKFDYKKNHIVMVLGTLLTALLFLLNQPFEVYAYPVVIGVVYPALLTAYEVFTSKERLNLSSKFLSIFLVLHSIHILDYPLLRFSDFAILGFSIALILLFGLSVVLPSYVIAINSQNNSLELKGEFENKDKELAETKDYFNILDKSVLTQLQLYQERFDENSALLSTLSHDLGGALQIILLNNYRLDKELEKVKDTYPELLVFNQKNKDATGRIITMLDSIRKIQKNILKGADVNEIIFNSSDLFSSVSDNCLDEAEKKEIKFSFDSDCSELVTFGDSEILFKNVIANLVRNAIKFSHRGSEVSINIKSTDEIYYIIEITDSGVGISSHDIENIFDLEKSKRLLGTEGEKGSGVNLSIAKKFMSLYSGTVKVHSELEVGSTFSVYLKKYVSYPEA